MHDLAVIYVVPGGLALVFPQAVILQDGLPRFTREVGLLYEGLKDHGIRGFAALVFNPIVELPLLIGEPIVLPLLPGTQALQTDVLVYLDFFGPKV